MNTFVLIIVYLFLSTFGLLLLKSGLNSFHINFQALWGRYEITVTFKFIIGFFLYTLSFFVWLIILSRKEISFIYPIVIGLSYFVITITALIFLKETISLVKLIGIIFVGAGIIVIIFSQ